MKIIEFCYAFQKRVRYIKWVLDMRLKIYFSPFFHIYSHALWSQPPFFFHNSFPLLHMLKTTGSKHFLRAQLLYKPSLCVLHSLNHEYTLGCNFFSCDFCQKKNSTMQISIEIFSRIKTYIFFSFSLLLHFSLKFS